MSRSGSHYFAQSLPPTLPAEICFQVSMDLQPPTFTPVALGDQVFITEALYDVTNQSLSVRASSSDQVVAQTLTVDGLGVIDPASGQLLATLVAAPPEKGDGVVVCPRHEPAPGKHGRHCAKQSARGRQR
ncbi:MAG: hypothetical protein M5R38_13480 [Candidatus Methylomirabilis sp.]|nr:hypothetical protein [Candidatus Methylomirabilis sp.]